MRLLLNVKLRAIVYFLSVLLSIHFIYKFTRDLAVERQRKISALKQDHLGYLGLILLEYARRCGTFPKSLIHINAPQRCGLIEATNHNLTDIFNKPLYYKQQGHKAYLAYYANSTFFKTLENLQKTAIELDSKNQTLKFILLTNSQAKNCCNFKVY